MVKGHIEILKEMNTQVIRKMLHIKMIKVFSRLNKWIHFVSLIFTLGDWYNNQKDGDGVYKYASGKVYDGEWENNKKHGEGTLTCVDGGKYRGKWKKGVWKG